jgi:RNA polymerase sigma factor (sigma-70 family)
MEQAASAEDNTPDVPPTVHEQNEQHTAAWCAHCSVLYDPHHLLNPSQERCPECGAAASAWNVEALYRAHAPRLLRYVQRLIRDWGLSDALVDAEGVVNEVFTEMIQLIGISYSKIRNPTAWLFVVARRQVSRAIHQGRRIADGDPLDHVVIGASVRWSSLAPRPSANDLRGTLIALDALADLPDRQKVAFYLRKIEGWTLEEIGEYLDCAASTAGVHVHRGTDRIRKLLADSWEPTEAFVVQGPVLHGDIQIIEGRPALRRGLVPAALALVGLIAGALGIAPWLRVSLWLAGALGLVAVLVVGGVAVGCYALVNALDRRRARTRSPRSPRRVRPASRHDPY